MSTSSDSPSSAANRSASEKRLYELWGELRDLRSIQEVLDWDQETHMPSKGVTSRAHVAGTLATLNHRATTSDEIWDVVAACAEEAEEGSVLEAQARVAKHQLGRARRIPEDLARAKAVARSKGTKAWQEARQAADFKLFEESLGELIHLSRQEAAALDPDGNAYDALMDRFEQGATEEELVPLFDSLVDELSPMIRAVVEEGRPVDESVMTGHFPMEKQRQLALHAATALGFDFEAGRLDPAAHPFCIGIAPSDVRLTWRWQEDDFRPGLFGVLHETGHGLYEQGLPADWHRTPLGSSVSLGIHESQSRLFENHVGRSRGFWRWLWPTVCDLFPDMKKLSVDEIWPALHTVKPSLIRVEADEGTYNLHVAIRFQIERALFRGDLEVADLPGAWDDAYEAQLGLRPKDAAEGVLQDIHWSQAIFGYFPTYTLGNLSASQLYEAASKDLGDPEEAMEKGEFEPLLQWMRDNIHSQGCRCEAGELIERSTGSPRSSDAMLAYLKDTTEAVYGASALSS